LGVEYFFHGLAGIAGGAVYNFLRNKESNILFEDFEFF
jgi:hypothetical protein